MQRWSKLFIPTLREAPADAEVASHKFLVRAGYVRQLAAGIYSYLFLAQRTILKITGIVREEMDTIGQEFYLPALNPREVWEASGRWDVMGDNMFRLKDRKGADLCLGMTHEEIMTDIARKELRSYKQLPQIWYQIQTKFRDEPRPKSGLLRVRQFTMKDSYSFDIDRAGLDKSFDLHDAVYRRIFRRCGLEFVAVEADSGSMGGSQSQEFMVYTDAGEDDVASCRKCKYAANREKATSRLPLVEGELLGNKTRAELVHTPGKRTIQEVSSFLDVSPSQVLKAVIYLGEEQDPITGKVTAPVKNPYIIMALVRGDHEVQEEKLKTALAHLGLPGIRPAGSEEVDLLVGPHGFVGPMNLPSYDGNRLQVILDSSLNESTGLVCGGGKPDYHFVNVAPITDFPITNLVDIQAVNAGDPCPVVGCGEPLKLGKAVEIGHIFKLGKKYSEKMGAKVLDSNGKEVPIEMGSYGIGVERILTSCIEQNHDDNGFWLAPSIAPFTVVVVPTNVKDAALLQAGEKIAAELEAAGYDVLLDDRDERPGVKFKDADLVGIPYRINIGKKLAEGNVEVVQRAKSLSADVAVGDILSHLRELYDPRA
jgi:prolyl-tRNA synthetase